MKYPRIHGLVAAPFTPFHEDGSLHLDLIPRYAMHLAENGVAGAFVCGTTGEGPLLTVTERKLVAEGWVKFSPSPVRVIVHTGHNSLADACDLAKHAQEIGAAATSLTSPSFFKPATIRDLVDTCALVAAAAPDLPFYYYNIPSMTGVNLSVPDFLQAAKDRIPNLAGVKFTHENLMDYAGAVRLDNGRFDILFGRDEMLLASLVSGAKGAVGSTYNYIAPIFNRLLDAYRKGDLATAEAEQAKANAIIGVMIRHGGLPAGKAIMKLLGLDCGPVRLPLRDLTDTLAISLRDELEKVGFSPVNTYR
jgi:N-acetylneuraminate lyase